MKVIRCGSAAFGSVVEDRPPETKIGHELKKAIDMFRDVLAAMV
jgi:hypothetical protein